MDIHELNSAHISIQVAPDDLQRFISNAVEKAITDHISKQQPPAKNPDKLYSINDLMERFGVSRISIWSWEKKGLLKSVRIGNLKRFKESDIQNFINKTGK